MLREVAVPLDPLVVRLVLPARAALAAQLGEVAAEVLLQPGTDLGAERLVLLAVGQIHADTVAYQALVWSRQARPRSRQERPMSVPPQQRPGTLPGVLRAAAERYGDQAAYVEGDRTLSFTELLEQVRAVARGYVALGLEPGGRVVVWAPNSIDWVVAGLAVSYAGGTLVPANSRYTGHEVADIVDRTGRESRAGRRRVPRPHPDRRPAGGQRPRLRARGRRPRQPRLGEPARRRRPSRRRSRRGPTRSPPTTSPTSCSPPGPPGAPRAR